MQVTNRADFASLPRGAFVRYNGLPHLVTDYRLYPYQTSGYAAPCPRPHCGHTEVLNPAPMIKVMQAGYTPAIHPSVV